MENKGPEAGDDKNCADQEKDRYEGFPIHLGRVMIMNTTVSGLGGRKNNLVELQKVLFMSEYVPTSEKMSTLWRMTSFKEI
jgi:hypothetical protein